MEETQREIETKKSEMADLRAKVTSAFLESCGPAPESAMTQYSDLALSCEQRTPHVCKLMISIPASRRKFYVAAF